MQNPLSIINLPQRWDTNCELWDSELEVPTHVIKNIYYSQYTSYFKSIHAKIASLLCATNPHIPAVGYILIRKQTHHKKIIVDKKEYYFRLPHFLFFCLFS
jgi:hypothetical protein